MYIVLFTGVLGLSMGSIVFAQPTTVQTLPDNFTAPGDIFKITNNIANWVFTVLIIASVFVVLIAAFTFVVAGGNPEAVSRARSQLIWAAVGIIIALLARAFPSFVQGIVT